MNELFYSIISILLGGFFVFLSNIFLSITQDDIILISNANDDRKDELIKINIKHEQASNGIIFLETVSYLLSAVFFAFYITELQLDTLTTSLYIIIFFASIFILRILLIGLAIRMNIILAQKLTGLLKYFYSFAALLAKPVDKFILVLAGKEPEEAARDEINALVETALEEGSLDEDEYRLMKNVMHYSDVYVSDVMTPRTVVFAVEADKTIADVLNMPELQMYSRFPIWEGKSLDDGVVGYVVTKNILTAALSNKHQSKLRNFAREIHYIPENATLDSALEQFIKLRQHMFLVVDEYGGIEGLISMEDVLENILGVEIVDEADRVVDMRDLAKQRRDKRIMNMLQQANLNEDEK